MEYSIGMDIGGTKISAGIVDRSGNVSSIRKMDTSRFSMKDEVLDVICGMVVDLLAIAERDSIRITGIGIGSAGQVDYKNGRIMSGTDNINDWNDVHMKTAISSCTDLPVFLDNDGNAFAIAEHQLGFGRGRDDLICLTLGTGIGGGVISSGHLIRGSWGGGGELGHLTVNFKGPACNCGSCGCMEAYASGTGMVNRMLERIRDPDSPNLEIYRRKLDILDSKMVLDWYSEGLEEAVSVVEEAISALAYGCVNLIHTFNPELIVFGGGLAEGNRWMVDKVKEKVSQLGMESMTRGVDFKISRLGYDTGLIGAACQTWTNEKEVEA